MKTHEQKYKEAVERNLRNAPAKKSKYENMNFWVAKSSLGIKKTDTLYDEQVKKLIEKRT